MTAQYLQHKFGDSVRVEYVDFAEPQAREQYGVMLEEIQKRRMRLPVTMVDDAIVAEGHIDYWAIEQAMEEKNQQINGS